MAMSQLQQFAKVIVEPSAEEATRFAAELVKTIICEAVSNEEKLCRVALSGGTTPHGLYQMLAKAAVSGEVPWSNVEIFFGDERDVPHDHADSNYRMAQRALLDHVPIQPQRIHPMPADAEDLEAAAAGYEAMIRDLVPRGKDNIPCFDLILLGMGGEGHVASLFPGTEVLEENKKLVVSYFVPSLGRNRMTFTFPLLNAAKNIILLVTDSDKANAIASLLGEYKKVRSQLPAAHIVPSEGMVVLVLDASAARKTDIQPPRG